ncbi:Uncharacterized protein PCOAH_00008420 [Plasmodium coatneyi]|uniref:Uncharacterized protein n=1 Tax=Plasmodium coatneyi TaxID=208452 RepID=A0A1B1DV76_9APIC|nr:Uncharacterized protein PCOAH_00008420 [Plasmodium coatneyi]ANQ06485.1 Uncharacterized protein PCOAH_00008420 [Plasmodium coatneyi]
MTAKQQNDPPPQLYTSTISDAINRYSLMGTEDLHSGTFELYRNASKEDVSNHSDWTFLQDDTSDEEGELQTYTSIVLGGRNKPIRRRATEGEYSPYGLRGKIKDSPQERPMDVLLNKQAEQEEDWTKRIFKILLTAEEANKSKDFHHIVKTIEHEEIKELVLYHSKVVLSEIRKVYKVLGGLVNGGGLVRCKGRFDVFPREEERLHRLRSKRGKHNNLRIKKCYLLNRYYRRLCRIYEEENSLLRRLCVGHRVGDANQVGAFTNGHNNITTKNLLLKCGITYQAKVGRTFPVQIKSKWKWIRGALKRASKPRLNLNRDNRIFRFVPHVDMHKKHPDGESLEEETSGPNGETQNSHVGTPKVSTSKCYVYETEAEVKSGNEMDTPNGQEVNDCADAPMEEECTEGITEEEKPSQQNDPPVGEEALADGVKESIGGDTSVDVTVNEQSEQTGEAPLEENPKEELYHEHEKRDNHLTVANSKLEQMDESHLVESNMDKKTKLKKKKKVAERGEKEEKKKKKKNFNLQQTNVVTEKEEDGTGDPPVEKILDKDTEERNEGVVPSQEVYHDCTH